MTLSSLKSFSTGNFVAIMQLILLVGVLNKSPLATAYIRYLFTKTLHVFRIINKLSYVVKKFSRMYRCSEKFIVCFKNKA